MDGNRCAPVVQLRHGRGDFLGFAGSMIVFGSCLIGLVYWYAAMETVLGDFWPDRSFWYLEEYRALSAKVWRAMYRFASSAICAWIPVLWLASIYLIQSGLPRERARLFNQVHVGFTVAVFGAASVCLLHLLMLPLGLIEHAPQ